MSNILTSDFDFKDVPPMWMLCFCDECSRHADCLRYIVGLQVPDNVLWGPAIYPSAYRSGRCKYFKEIRKINAAYGFNPLFKEIKFKHSKLLRDKLKEYLGSHGAYYRYNRGERLLTPEQQEWIIRLFASYGYTEKLAFEHYKEVLDFSENIELP